MIETTHILRAYYIQRADRIIRRKEKVSKNFNISEKCLEGRMDNESCC